MDLLLARPIAEADIQHLSDYQYLCFLSMTANEES